MRVLCMQLHAQVPVVMLAESSNAAQGTDREARRRRAALMGVTEEDLDAEDFQLFSGARLGTEGRSVSLLLSF
jgi:hypothetical protein